MSTRISAEDYTHLLSADYWAFIQRINALVPDQFMNLAPREQRAAYTKMLYSLENKLPTHLRIQDHELPIANRTIPIRSYQVTEQMAAGHIIYFHGKGDRFTVRLFLWECNCFVSELRLGGLYRHRQEYHSSIWSNLFHGISYDIRIYIIHPNFSPFRRRKHIPTDGIGFMGESSIPWRDEFRGRLCTLVLDAQADGGEQAVGIQ